MIGRTLGKYTITQELNSGGMATVYLGHREDIDQTVAIKILDERRYSNPKFQARFQLEARAVAKLNYKYILPIYDFHHDKDDGLAYIVMRYIEGGSLNELIHQNTLDLNEVSKVLYQIGSALDYAHRNNIIHRDIKPSNIMCDDNGDYFLSDFGIAKHVDGDFAPLTDLDNIMGTPHYMSPEQCRGETALTPASDIYSLGITLFEMLTGKTPFDDKTPLATVNNHLVKPIPDIMKYRHDLHPAFQKVVERVLAKDPKDRYQTCQELEKAFDKALRMHLHAVQRTTDGITETIYNKNEETQKRFEEAQQKRREIEQQSQEPEQKQQEAPPVRKEVQPLSTGPIGYVNVYIQVQDLPHLSTRAQVRSGVELKKLLEDICVNFGIAYDNRTFVLDGRELNLNRTVGQNSIPQKSKLIIKHRQNDDQSTLKWLRTNQTPLQFEPETLIYLHDEGSGTYFQLNFQPAIIGRYDANPRIPHINKFLAVDLTKLDRQANVSRQHACITRRRGQYYIENLKERNTTYVDGKRLEHNQRYPLQAGSRIRVGRITLIFEIH